MKISVIIPSYNAADYIQQAVENVLEQNFNDNFELIIVDDCSTDSTLAILESYRSNKRVRILKTDRNLGYPGAMNLGLSFARGKYISRMDADDVVNPLLLQMTFNFHEALGEDVAFVSSKRFWISHSGYTYHKIYDASAMHIHEYWEDLINRNRLFTDVGTLFKRNIAEAVGGYNDYQRSGMDVDLWLRMMEYTGKPCLTLIHPLVGKRLVPDSIIFRPNTTNANNVPRELALLRKSRKLPPDYKPSKDWLTKVRKDNLEDRKSSRKVRMTMEVALINRWLGERKGFIAFLKLSLKRNPLVTMKILIQSRLFGWKHDFIKGSPNLELMMLNISAGQHLPSRQVTPTYASRMLETFL